MNPEQLKRLTLTLLILALVGCQKVEQAAPVPKTLPDATKIPVRKIAASSWEWRLVKIKEGGADYYTIASCDAICDLTGYRFAMDERKDAEELWQEFVDSTNVGKTNRTVEIIK